MKLAFCGLSGRVGHEFANEIVKHPQYSLLYGLGKEAEENAETPVYVNFKPGLAPVDVLIDFSRPEFVLACLERCPPEIKAVISGTTGFSDEQRRLLEAHAKQRLIFHAANFSIGVLAMVKAVERMAPLARAWTACLTETHHAGKKDAPSGTAMWIARAMQAAGGPTASIESIREGDAVGTHDLRLTTVHETLRVTHSAHTRALFIDGVLTVLDWIEKTSRLEQKGLIGMDEYFESL